jgi:hypothetical protein
MTTQKHDCEKCENMNICKFVSDMKKAKHQVEHIGVPALSPIKIHINCSSFKQQGRKQDGINFGRGL